MIGLVVQNSPNSLPGAPLTAGMPQRRDAERSSVSSSELQATTIHTYMSWRLQRRSRAEATPTCGSDDATVREPPGSHDRVRDALRGAGVDLLQPDLALPLEGHDVCDADKSETRRLGYDETKIPKVKKDSRTTTKTTQKKRARVNNTARGGAGARENGCRREEDRVPSAAHPRTAETKMTKTKYR